jgi:hypothetical protein
VNGPKSIGIQPRFDLDVHASTFWLHNAEDAGCSLVALLLLKKSTLLAKKAGGSVETSSGPHINSLKKACSFCPCPAKSTKKNKKQGRGAKRESGCPKLRPQELPVLGKKIRYNVVLWSCKKRWDFLFSLKSSPLQQINARGASMLVSMLWQMIILKTVAAFH